MSEIGRNRVLVVKNAGARARSGAIAVASRPIIVHLSGVSSHLSDFLRGVLRTCCVVNRKSLFFVESAFFVEDGRMHWRTHRRSPRLVHEASQACAGVVCRIVRVGMGLDGVESRRVRPGATWRVLCGCLCWGHGTLVFPAKPPVAIRHAPTRRAVWPTPAIARAAGEPHRTDRRHQAETRRTTPCTRRRRRAWTPTAARVH